MREDGSKVYGLNSEMHDKWLENFANMLIKECAIIASKAENNENELRCMYDVIVERFNLK